VCPCVWVSVCCVYVCMYVCAAVVVVHYLDRHKEDGRRVCGYQFIGMLSKKVTSYPVQQGVHTLSVYDSHTLMYHPMQASRHARACTHAHIHIHISEARAHSYHRSGSLLSWNVVADKDRYAACHSAFCDVCVSTSVRRARARVCLCVCCVCGE